jgi:4,5-dihydroxyphthalate decarboxylase
VEARDLALDGLYDTDALRIALPWLIDHVEEARREFGEDFWAYGLEPNRPAFEAIGRYVHEQGLSPRVVSADELFVPDVE